MDIEKYLSGINRPFNNYIKRSCYLNFEPEPEIKRLVTSYKRLTQVEVVLSEHLNDRRGVS
ncbi:MAG: hypothetical protein QME40_04975 [bacterium]|nr:hypothetical protein [bacterium]